jgi:hypothetical protein
VTKKTELDPPGHRPPKNEHIANAMAFLAQAMTELHSAQTGDEAIPVTADPPGHRPPQP